MRRMVLLVAVVALMAAMVAASAVTGLAQVEEGGQYQYQTEDDGWSDPRQDYNCSYNDPDEYGEPTGYTEGCL